MAAVTIVRVYKSVMCVHYPDCRCVAPDTACGAAVPCGNEAVEVILGLPAIGVGDSTVYVDRVLLCRCILGGHRNGHGVLARAEIHLVAVSDGVGVSAAISHSGESVIGGRGYGGRGHRAGNADFV